MKRNAPFTTVKKLRSAITQRSAELDAINLMYRGKFSQEATERYEQVLKTKRRQQARLQEIEEFTKKNFNLTLEELLTFAPPA